MAKPHQKSLQIRTELLPTLVALRFKAKRMEAGGTRAFTRLNLALNFEVHVSKNQDINEQPPQMNHLDDSVRLLTVAQFVLTARKSSPRR
jgi:hypothetical protein